MESQEQRIARLQRLMTAIVEHDPENSFSNLVKSPYWKAGKRTKMYRIA